MIIILLMLYAMAASSLMVLYSVRLIRHSYQTRHDRFRLWVFTQWFLLSGTMLFGLVLLFLSLILVGTALLKPEIYDQPLLTTKALTGWMITNSYNFILLILIAPVAYWKTSLYALTDQREKQKRLLIRLGLAIAAAAFFIWANYDFFLSDHSILNRLNAWLAFG